MKKLKRREVYEMLEYQITDNLSVRLKNGKTKIYVQGKVVGLCKHLLLDIPREEFTEEGLKVDSIDELIRLYKSSEFTGTPLDPEEEFWGHCSNLEGWVENGYDLRLIDSRLAEVILSRLAPVNKKAFELFFNQLDDQIKRYLSEMRKKMFLKKWKYSVVRILLGRFGRIEKEMVQSSPFLRALIREEGGSIHRDVIEEYRKSDKFKQQRNYYERKLWGTRGDYMSEERKRIYGVSGWMDLRRQMREIRNLKKGVEVSPIKDYIYYVWVTTPEDDWKSFSTDGRTAQYKTTIGMQKRGAEKYYVIDRYTNYARMYSFRYVRAIVRYSDGRMEIKTFRSKP